TRVTPQREARCTAKSATTQFGLFLSIAMARRSEVRGESPQREAGSHRNDAKSAKGGGEPACASSRPRLHDAGFRGAGPPGRADGDFDIATESVQEAKKPLDGKSIESSPEQCRDLRLVDSQDFCRPCLRELSRGDSVRDALDERCLRKKFLR